MTDNTQIESNHVIAFLQENPDFFTQNPMLLTNLHFEHDTNGSATSLIQRQVELLRSHLSQNRERLSVLARNAKHNESLLKRFQELAVALASPTDHNHAVTILQRTICLDFGLSLLELYVPEGIWDDPNEQVVALDKESFDAFSNTIYGLPLFLGKPSSKLRETVFANKESLTRSIALIRVSVGELSLIHI